MLLQCYSLLQFFDFVILHCTALIGKMHASYIKPALYQYLAQWQAVCPVQLSALENNACKVANPNGHSKTWWCIQCRKSSTTLHHTSSDNLFLQLAAVKDAPHHMLKFCCVVSNFVNMKPFTQRFLIQVVNIKLNLTTKLNVVYDVLLHRQQHVQPGAVSFEAHGTDLTSMILN